MSTSADRNLHHLYPEFGQKIDTVQGELAAFCLKHFPDYQPVAGEGFRSTARQQELYAQGRTASGNKVTNADGVKNRSNHQSSLAYDQWFERWNGSKWVITWDVPRAIYEYYGHLLRAKGLKWGGNWRSLPDTPHGEWDPADKATYAKAREWQKAQGLK